MANETEAKGSGIFAILKQSVKEFVDDDAPTMAAATMARSSGSLVSYDLYRSTMSDPPKRDWLDCQNPMTTYEPIANTDAPATNPSRPSATFTPFEVDPSAALAAGVNELAVRVTDPPAGSVDRVVRLERGRAV